MSMRIFLSVLFCFVLLSCAERGKQTEPAQIAAQEGAQNVLPFGELRPVCEVKGNLGKQGKKIGTSKKGAQAFTLYDSAPKSTQLRSFYITGFKDGCPRQFTASLALFGSVKTFDTLHQAGAKAKASKTGKAYAKIRKKICKGGKKQPCSDKELNKIARNTAFLSIYERFGSQARWMDVVLHKRELVAQALH